MPQADHPPSPPRVKHSFSNFSIVRGGPPLRQASVPLNGRGAPSAPEQQAELIPRSSSADELVAIHTRLNTLEAQRIGIGDGALRRRLDSEIEMLRRELGVERTSSSQGGGGSATPRQGIEEEYNLASFVPSLPATASQVRGGGGGGNLARAPYDSSSEEEGYALASFASSLPAAAAGTYGSSLHTQSLASELRTQSLRTQSLANELLELQRRERPLSPDGRRSAPVGAEMTLSALELDRIVDEDVAGRNAGRRMDL